MGNQNSQGSFHTSKKDTVNFIHSSSGEQQNTATAVKKEDTRDTDVWQTFTWNYGGNVVLLTGSFFKWKETIGLEKQGEEFSVTIQLPRGIHQYKFIVDGEWRFSPDDPIMPDEHGNINNVSDTNQFKKMIDPPTYKKSKAANPRILTKDRLLTKKLVFKVLRNLLNMPQSYLHIMKTSAPDKRLNGLHSQTKMEDENRKFEESLTQTEIHELFNTSHCLPPPYHVEVDHLIRQANKTYGAYAITQRFKNKYTTYKYFMIEKEEMAM